MGREADSLPIFGYLIVLGLFAGMIAFCFIWGVWEYKKPKDSGPLFIDLDRNVEKTLKEHGGIASRTLVNEPYAHSRKALKMAEGIESIHPQEMHDTIRVRGDIVIPKGELVPYNIVVEGNLTSKENVIFQGGLHVKGRAIIGAHNRLEKSIVCQKELVLLEDVAVYNCIDCDGLVFIKKGVRVGVGGEGGGIASARTIWMENAKGPLKIHSKENIRIVGTLREVIPEDLEQVIEVKAA
jgi:hypothetical protein